ncbi:MAG: hypothetical protein ACT4P5_12170 [Armatimonadota bacterium]
MSRYLVTAIALVMFLAAFHLAGEPPVWAAQSPVGVPASQPRSGIEGKIVIGPNCPVVRGAGCADRPYQAMVLVKTATGSKEISRFRSQRNGWFHVPLPPGTYLLVPVSGNALPRPGAHTVVVKRNRFTSLVIRYDTGIR